MDLNATGENIVPCARRSTAMSASPRSRLTGWNNLAEALVAGKDQLGIKDSERTEAAKIYRSTPFSELKSSFRHQMKARQATASS